MACMVLKIKSKSGQLVLNDLTKNHTVSDLKTRLSQKCQIPQNALHVLSGFPPKPINLTNNSQTLDSIGVNSGDTLIIEEKDGSLQTMSNEPQIPNEAVDVTPLAGDRLREVVRQEYTLKNEVPPGILLRKVVPADNSCLFTSVGFALTGRVDTNCGSYMRQIIVEHVSLDPETYSEAILGKRPKEYCEWILKPESWGGAIELSILSGYYRIEMDVVDTANGIINRFGEDRCYSQRILLIFDGIHYDPLYLEPFDGSEIQTIFPINVETILEDAEVLAHEAKSSRQFTDVNKFSLKCLDCQVLMNGQVEAQEHAKSTGHVNFGEV